MNINFNGFGENAATFYADSTVKKGTLVKMSGSGTVAPCASGDSFCGVCLDNRDGYATVALSSFVKVPAAKAIAVGYQKLSASDANTATTATSGREYLVIESDSTSVGFIL